MTPIQSLLVTILLVTGPSKISCGVDDGSPDIPTENGVLVLTGETFPRVIQEHEFVLVMFSGAKCGHCHRLLPVYEEVAAELATMEQPPGVRVAKVDVSQERSFIAEYGIKTVPDVRLFRGGKPLDKYLGERTKEAIVEWVKGKVQAE